MEQFFERPNELRMLSRRFLAEFRASASETGWQKDSIWLSSGQLSHEVLLIQSGNLAVRQVLDGTGVVTMLYGAGSAVIVADSLFRQAPATATYRFLDDACVFTLGDRALDALRLKYLDAQYLLDYFIGEELARQKAHGLMLAQYEPEQRVAYAIRYFKEPFGLLNREEQATFLGITRRAYQRYV